MLRWWVAPFRAGATRAVCSRAVLCFDGDPLLFTGVLRFCSVWWQQSGLLHDVGQDFPSELVVTARRTVARLRAPGNLEFLATGAQTAPGSHTAVCADAACGVLPSCPPALLQLTPDLFVFLFFFLLKNKSGCNAAGAVQILPSGAISVVGRASDQKAHTFPSAPEFPVSE